MKALCYSSTCIHNFLMTGNEEYRAMDIKKVALIKKFQASKAGSDTRIKCRGLIHKLNDVKYPFVRRKESEGVPVQVKKGTIECPTCGWALYWAKS